MEHQSQIEDIVFTSDGTTLFTAGLDRLIVRWERRALDFWVPAQTLRGHSRAVRALALSPNEGALLSADHDGALVLWRATGRPAESVVWQGHDRTTRDVAFAGNRLFSAGGDGLVLAWGTVAGGADDPVALMRFTPPARAVAASESADLVAASGGVRGSQDAAAVSVWRDGEVATLDVADGETVWDLALSPDGTTLASARDGGRILVQDSLTGRVMESLRAHDNKTVFAVAFSPDGQKMATGGADERVILWRWQEGEGWVADPPLPGFRSHVRALAFSGDGRLLGADGRQSTVIWEVSTSKHAATLRHGPSGGFGISFSPDGRLVARAGGAGAIHIWDVATHELLAELPSEDPGVWQVTFLDDNRLAAGTADGSITLWDLDLAAAKDRACAIAGRNFSGAEWSQLPGVGRYAVHCPRYPAPDEHAGAPVAEYDLTWTG